MTDVLHVYGSRNALVGILNLLASKAQSKGSVIFIDSGGLFDAEFIEDAAGTISDITLSRPRSAYQLRTLIDNKLPSKFGASEPYLIIVSCTAMLFDLVDPQERTFVTDYTYDSLAQLCSQGTLVLATTREDHTSAKIAAKRADVIMNADAALEKATDLAQD